MPCYSIDGFRPVVHPDAYVHPDATLIGDVIIAAGCYVAPGASLRGDFGRIVLGEGANVQDNCVMHGFPDTDTAIHKDGHIGHGAILHGCVVREKAMVGMNAVIMDGAVVGDASMVAAMSFVKAGFEVPARHLVAGIPARIVRELSDDDIAWKHHGTEDYHRLARRSARSMVACTPLDQPEPDRSRLKLEGASAPKYKQEKGKRR